MHVGKAGGVKLLDRPAKPGVSPPRRSVVSQALIELRKLLGETQQQFANRLGTAITTIARYETTRPPRGRVLVRLEQIARSEGHKNCARAFRSALEKEFGVQAPAVRIARKRRVSLLENPLTIYQRSQLQAAFDRHVGEINRDGDTVVEIRLEFETDKGHTHRAYIAPPTYQSITRKGKTTRKRVPRMLGPLFQIYG
jgi:transcriptional regulator with XRE-family HTH domain